MGRLPTCLNSVSRLMDPRWLTAPALNHANLKIKKPFKVRGKKHLLRSIKIAIREAPVQAGTQIVFQLGGKSKGYQ